MEGTPKQYTREEILDLEKQRKDYDKQSNKDARNQNSLIENLTGKGLIDKEDIMRIDAKIEDRQMNRTEWHQKGILDDVQNSTLTVHFSTETEGDSIGGYSTDDFAKSLNGLIKGKEVCIKLDGRRRDDVHPRYSALSGTIDGKTITPEFAQLIVNKYIDIASKRTREAESRREEYLETKRKTIFNKDIDKYSDKF